MLTVCEAAGGGGVDVGAPGAAPADGARRQPQRQHGADAVALVLAHRRDADLQLGDAGVIERARDRQLLVEGEGDAGGLFAVAQRGVVDRRPARRFGGVERSSVHDENDFPQLHRSPTFGIVEDEARCFDVIDEIDRHAADDRQAVGIDEDAHALEVVDLVAVLRGGLEAQHVLQAGAAALLDHDAEPAGRRCHRPAAAGSSSLPSR